MGKPEEIGAVVVWLCSDAAAFVIGHAMASMAAKRYSEAVGPAKGYPALWAAAQRSTKLANIERGWPIFGLHFP